MSKKEVIPELVAFVGEKYADETLKITQDNVRLSTKLSGILCMMDAYYTEYIENQRELIRIVDLATSEKAENEKDTEHLKAIKKTSKNKLNRIHNQNSRFIKFHKEFNAEFSKYFGENAGKMESILLDAFEVFWDEIVHVGENQVTVKEKIIYDENESDKRMDAIAQNGNTGEHYVE